MNLKNERSYPINYKDMVRLYDRNEPNNFENFVRIKNSKSRKKIKKKT